MSSSDNNGNTGRKGNASYLTSLSTSVSDFARRMNIGFFAGPTPTGGFGVGVEYPRREPTQTSSVTISPTLLEQLEKRKQQAAAPEPPKQPERARRRNTMPASQIWPDWATKTYRDPTAEARSQTLQLEERIKSADLEKAPVVGPFVGAKREIEELSQGKKPDRITMTRTVRVGVAVTPVRFFPGTTPVRKYVSRYVIGTAASKAVDEARKHSASPRKPPTGHNE